MLWQFCCPCCPSTQLKKGCPLLSKLSFFPSLRGSHSSFFILHSSFFIPPATRSSPAPSPHILRIFYGYSTLPLRVLSVETRKKTRENTENIRRKVGEGMKKMRQKLLNNVMSKTAKPFKYTTLTTVLYLRNMNNTPILS